jgi:hypothetical protein
MSTATQTKPKRKRSRARAKPKTTPAARGAAAGVGILPAAAAPAAARGDGAAPAFAAARFGPVADRFAAVANAKTLALYQMIGAGEQDWEILARSLECDRTLLEYHVQKLARVGLIRKEGAAYAMTAEGRIFWETSVAPSLGG